MLLQVLFPAAILASDFSAESFIDNEQITVAGQADNGQVVSICVEDRNGKMRYISQDKASVTGNYEFIFSLEAGEYQAGVSAPGKNTAELKLKVSSESAVTANVNKNQLVITGKAQPFEKVSISIKRVDGKLAYIGQSSADINGSFYFTMSLDKGQYQAVINAGTQEIKTLPVTIRTDLNDSSSGDSGSHHGKKYQAQISITGDSEKGKILKISKWEWTGKTTVLDALKSVLEKNKIEYKIVNAYVKSIDGLAEKKPGYPSSGWLYKVNGDFAACGAGDYNLKNGDTVKWVYTLDGGKDVGNSWIDSKDDDEDEVKPQGKEEKEQLRKKFSDLNDSFVWACEAVEILAGKDIIKGSDTGFEPARNISRAEIITIMVRASGLELSKKNLAFTDVAKTDWFYSYIATAVENGWVTGYPDGSFCPNQAVNRYELAVLLKKIDESTDKKPGSSISKKNIEFTDSEQFPAWACKAVEYVSSYGYLSGYPDGTYQGANNLNRAEAAVAVYRYSGI